MATQERLHKSLEILKTLSINQPPDQAKKKEKIHHCYVVAEAFSNPTIKVSSNFTVLLDVAIETFLKLSDDNDSDVRMTSDECLNRIIRAVSDRHLGKVQYELLKEIQKNGSSRSLRAALIRFSQLAHQIKPTKGKAYAANLLPKIVRIAERTEEVIHETLVACLPKILQSLGPFALDNDLKELLKSFLQNINKPSAAIRRTSASCIEIICRYSRRPSIFTSYCVNCLLDLVIPVDVVQDAWFILGVLQCVKLLLTHLNNVSEVEDEQSRVVQKLVQPIATNKLLQIYELCIYYLTNPDHNIVNASLDTLNTLLLNAPNDLKIMLLNPNGIDRSRIHKSLSVNNIRSPSQLSMTTNITLTDDLIFSENEFAEVDIEQWISVSKLTIDNLPNNSELDLSVETPIEDNSGALSYDDSSEMAESIIVTNRPTSADDLDKYSDHSSVENDISSDKKVLNIDGEFCEVDIGNYLDKLPSLLYCTRLLSKLFLLPGISGKYINDHTVRVSVKSTALSCLSSVFRLYPFGFFAYLDINYSLVKENSISNQKICDILLFADHPDPQLRGITRLVISDLVVTILTETKLDYMAWRDLLQKNTHSGISEYYDIERLVDIWLKGLKDENSNCLKQTLISLQSSLNLIACSSSCVTVLPILDILPGLANNPYWLVKVAICELVSNISYITIHFITQSDLFQQKILYNVLFDMLKDSDQRIRSAASQAIANILEHLYSDDYHPKENIVTTEGLTSVKKYLSNFNSKDERNHAWRHFIDNIPFPYSQLPPINSQRIDHFLSKIVMKLYTKMLESNSKYFIYGCIEALSMLSNKYPCTMYKVAWGISKNCFKIGTVPLDIQKNLLGLCLTLLSSSIHVYDIPFLINLLNLTTNLYSGCALVHLKTIDLTEENNKFWSMFSNESLKSISDRYLSIIMKFLNIFHYVINDSTPVLYQNKSSLPHLPSSATLSPMKRRKSDDRKLSLTTVRITLEKDEKMDRNFLKNMGLGYFANSQHYLKIYGTLKNAYANYKTSLDLKASENVIEILRKTIRSLSIILEFGTLNEFGKISEEILSYLKYTFQLDMTLTVQCVQQLLKCLFGTNLISNINIIEDTEEDTKLENYSFYYNLFEKPYEEISFYIQSLNNISRIECDDDNTIMGYLHRKDLKNPAIATSRTLDETLASYIRVFEPIVINALKQFTVTSNVIFQCNVLKLLSQMVHLRINYCLVDPEQVFKDFVLKQFEYIEEGLVPHSEELIPRIFQFLVQLSYLQQHNKNLIDIPKIIQLCDGLMASGQEPRTHCIPALEPIVEDVFLIRNRSNTTDMKELETTREVVMAMLLRLLEYKEVIDLVTLVLDDSKYRTDNTSKWLDWSVQVAAVFLHLLKQDKVRIDDEKVFKSLRKLILALNPNVFRPGSDVIIMLFQAPPSMIDEQTLCKWLSKVVILFLIISPIKEQILLAEVNSVKADFNPASVLEHFTAIADPLNVYNNAATFENIPAETIIAKFIFRVTSILTNKLVQADLNSNGFLINQFSVFLMFCSHIFQTGSLCKVSQVAVSLLRENGINIDQINNNFLSLKTVYPSLVFQWCHILSVLNYNSLDFWNVVITPNINSLKEELVQVGGTIVFCDYLNENISETKQLAWILSARTQRLVKLIDEVPVAEFISFIHRNSTLSKLFINSITQHCLTNKDPIFKTNILKCVENCHSSQTGAVIKLLVPKLLYNRQTTISRTVAQLASRKIEYLFTMSKDEVTTQLSKEDLFIIKEELNTRLLSKKYEALISLFNKLLIQYYDLSPLNAGQSRLNTEAIRKLSINKKWLLSQIQAKYQDGILRKETSKVMERLEYNELFSFMSSYDFNEIILKDCIERGVKILKEEKLNEEPPILKAAIDKILIEVNKIVNQECVNHEIFSTVHQNEYSIKIQNIFETDSFSTKMANICFSLSALSKHLAILPTIQLNEIDRENIAKLAIISLEFINFMFSVDKSNLNINNMELLLDCSNEILKNAQFSSYLGLDVNVLWLCSGINSIHDLTCFLLKSDDPLPLVEKSILKYLGNDKEIPEAQNSCHNLYILTCWLYKIQCKFVYIPSFILCRLRSIIISLSRLPMVNSFNLIPCKVWKIGWEPSVSGKFHTEVPALPIDMLQEIDVLVEYIFRITLLGWTTRQQFEETWMCFLSVLCSNPYDIDVTDLIMTKRASGLAIKAITALLVQTLRYPVLGNRNASKIIHVSRCKAIPDTSISIKKLKVVQDKLEKNCLEYFPNLDLRNVFSIKNFEKINDKYSYGQMSVRYFLVATNSIEENLNTQAAIVYKERTRLLYECGLDINSCLQFLLDYYAQQMKPEAGVTDIRLLHEMVRSTLHISDLFTDKSQFNWMLDMFLTLSKIHSVEDELIHQYLIVGICKATAVLLPDIDMYEQVRKLLVQFLKSPFLPTRISCLYGLLYMAEGCVLSNVSIGGISEEFQLILPCACEYIQIHLTTNNPVLIQSQEHAMLLWSLAFYLIENVDELHMEPNFVTNILQTALIHVQKRLNDYISKSIVKALERILVVKPRYMLEKVGKNIERLALDQMRDENPSVSILGVQLLITYMYVDCWEHLEKPDIDNEQSSPDHLVQTVEKINAIFERVKKSNVDEVQILCSVLPLILKDFFLPSDILTKVIGEFLSQQQSHPMLMSGVVFQVFENAIKLKQLSLLQDWVVINLSNFTQTCSNMSIWCLTCFFISASSNLWLKTFFPYVQSRVGRCEYEDRKIFCIAGADFYKNLTNDRQRKDFVDSFVKVKGHVDMPFGDLLNSL